MGIGHFAVGLAAKSAVPRVSLAWLLLATQFVDVLWGIFVLLGIEHARIRPGITAASPFDFYYYPITHSLLGGILWALLFGGAYFIFRRYRAGAVMLGLLVLSHWVLDVIAHRPDVGASSRLAPRARVACAAHEPPNIVEPRALRLRCSAADRAQPRSSEGHA
jgi:hypothetical protein